MDYTTLKAELTDDPLSRGYAEMTDVEAAADLNTPARERLEPIASVDLLSWAAGNGRFASVIDATTSGGKPSRAIAIAADRILFRADTTLDLSRADRMAFVDALVAAKIFTADDKTSLVMLATKAVSRATELGIGLVRSGYVQKVRAE